MPAHPLRVVIAEENEGTSYCLVAYLRFLGHHVSVIPAHRTECHPLGRDPMPDLLLLDIGLRDSGGMAFGEATYLERPLPIMVVSHFYDDEMLARAQSSHVMAYLVQPIEAPDLAAAMSIAIRRFGQWRELEEDAVNLKSEIQRLQDALAERKLIERAKGILTRMLRIDDEDAYRRLRTYANHRNVKLLEAAHSVIDAEEIFRKIRRIGEGHCS